MTWCQKPFKNACDLNGRQWSYCTYQGDGWQHANIGDGTMSGVTLARDLHKI